MKFIRRRAEVHASAPRNIGADEDGLPMPRLRPYAMGPERIVANHRFNGKTMAARAQTVSLGGQNIEIFSPAKLDQTQGVFHNAKQIAARLALLPSSSLALVSKVQISPVPNPRDAYWGQQYGMADFISRGPKGA